MTSLLRIGIIGLDTSHVVAFTKLLNRSEEEFHVPGGKVVIAYPGGSPDMELSKNRIAGYTETLQQEFGVKIVESIEEVAANADAILLESVDGRVHLEQFRKIAPYGKPTFIDKPLAVSLRDAQEIAELAAKHHVPLMSGSALRYSEPLQQALGSGNAIFGADCYGPLALQATQPGLFWYGIHTVDMLLVVLGTDCVQVQAVTNDDHDIVVGTWRDGRLGTIRGNRLGNSQFGVLIHRSAGTEYIDISRAGKPYYASLLEGIIEMFTTKRSPLDIEETLKVIQFIEAANLSRITHQPVRLEDVVCR